MLPPAPGAYVVQIMLSLANATHGNKRKTPTYLAIIRIRELYHAKCAVLQQYHHVTVGTFQHTVLDRKLLRLAERRAHGERARF